MFGGEVTHAGLPVSAGERVVFVASFSRRLEPGQHPPARGAGDGEEAEARLLERLYGDGHT